MQHQAIISKILLLLAFMSMRVSLSLSVDHVQVPIKARKGDWILLNWSYGWLWTAMRVLKTPCWSSTRASGVLKSSISFVVTFGVCLFCFAQCKQKLCWSVSTYLAKTETYKILLGVGRVLVKIPLTPQALECTRKYFFSFSLLHKTEQAWYE